MVRNPIVGLWSTDDIRAVKYDAVITTVGYERRARYIVDNFSPQGYQKTATAFEDNCVLDFEKNLIFYEKAGYNIEYLSDDNYYHWAQQTVETFESKTDVTSLLIDISSMSRYRLAAMVWALASYSGRSRFRIDFAYSFAKYNPPPRKTGPITNIGPIVSDFAGWFGEPSSTCCAIIGLGYDLGKSVGTVEYIEPGEIWAMNPIGEDKKYERSVLEANKLFLDAIEPSRVIDYDALRPLEIFYRLESLVSGAMKSSRPVIIPFGPKIFALCSLVVALAQYPKVSVWRVSSGKYETIANRFPSGTVVGLRVFF